MSGAAGVSIGSGATRFAVRAPLAEAVWLCLFDEAGERREPMARFGETWIAELPGDLAGAHPPNPARGSPQCD